MILKPLSILPMRFLYLLSNIAAFLLENVFAYRKKVIDENLKNSFPNKTDFERKKIRKQFYLNFADVFIESLKSLSISVKTAQKEVVYEGKEILEQFYLQNRDVILVMGHLGNWEKICSILPVFVSHKILGVYKPLKNLFFDKKVKSIRSKFGVDLVAMKDTNKRIKEKVATPKAIILIADQSPSNPQRSFWTSFLNQETGVMMGTEKFAKIYDLPVVYLNILKEKRGRYKVHFELLSTNSKTMPKGEITKLHTKALEENIVLYPHLWLWSHKRWKHKKTQ